MNLRELELSAVDNLPLWTTHGAGVQLGATVLAAPDSGCRDEGRPATTTPQEALPGVEQRADKQGTSDPPFLSCASMGQEAAQEATEAVPGIGRLPNTSRRPKGLLRPPERLDPLAA